MTETIADKLKRLYDNLVIAINTTKEFVEKLADCYTAVANKGGTVPQEQTAANLPDAIESIPSGKIQPMSLSFSHSLQTDDIVLADYVDTSKMTSMQALFAATKRNKISLVGCDTSNVTTMYQLAGDSYNSTHKFQYFDMEGCDTSKVEKWNYAFNTCLQLLKINIVGCSFAATTGNNYAFYHLTRCTSFIGDYTLNDVINNGITCLDGLKMSITIEADLLERATLLAMIKGVADVTSIGTQTLTIGSTNYAKLEAADIAIATAKGWTIQ